MTDSISREERVPFAYAYRYPAYPPEGATVIRLGTGGREINGSKPIETIPLYTADALSPLTKGERCDQCGKRGGHHPACILSTTKAERI